MKNLARPAAGLLLIAAVVLSVPACASQTGFLDKALVDDGETVRYVLYVPEGYDPARAWPLVVFLHGAGDRGTDGRAPLENGIGPAIREHPERFPALVLFPQCPEALFWDSVTDRVEQAMADTRRDYRVDAARVYLTGISMGGFGTWLWGAMKDDTFAALLPVCGGGSDIPARAKLGMRGVNPFSTYRKRVKRWVNLPIWAFHGAEDETVPPAHSSRTVESIRKAGGAQVKYTELPGVGHVCWDRVYGDPQVIAWLLAQRKAPPGEQETTGQTASR